MNLDHLKYFHDAVSRGSVSEAAKLNRVSQSAVSQALRALERELGGELLIHRKNRLELSDCGRAAFAGCSAVFAAVEDLRHSINLQQTEIVGDLSVGCTHSLAIHVLAPGLSRIKAEHPGVNIRLRLANSEIIRDWLRNREVDLGIFVDTPGRKEELASFPIRRGSYRLVSAPGSSPKLHERDLLVTRRTRPEVEHVYRAYRSRCGVSLRPPTEVLSWEVIRSLVSAGSSLGLIPDYLLDRGAGRERLKVWSPGFAMPTYEVRAFQLGRRVLPKVAAVFAESLRENQATALWRGRARSSAARSQPPRSAAVE